jgi:hypothetical protein
MGGIGSMSFIVALIVAAYLNVYGGYALYFFLKSFYEPNVFTK